MIPRGGSYTDQPQQLTQTPSFTTSPCQFQHIKRTHATTTSSSGSGCVPAETEITALKDTSRNTIPTSQASWQSVHAIGLLTCQPEVIRDPKRTDLLQLFPTSKQNIRRTIVKIKILINGLEMASKEVSLCRTPAAESVAPSSCAACACPAPREDQCAIAGLAQNKSRKENNKEA